MQKYFPLEFARDNFVFKGLEAYLLFYYVNLIDLSFQGRGGGVRTSDLLLDPRM